MSFTRYPAYKESGVEWLGRLPEHWDVLPLKRRFQILGGSTPKSDEERLWDGEIRWATPADLSRVQSLYINDTIRRITDEGFASCATNLVPPGSIILSTRAPIGSVAIASEPMCTNQGCKSLVQSGSIDARYFARVLAVSTAALNVRGKGTTFLELSAEELGNFPVPVPSSDEQTAIAEFLDGETTKIDALVAEQERLIELLKEKRQAVISHAVTKGLNPAAPMKDSGIEWLGEVPRHWSCSRIRHLYRPAKRQDQKALSVLSVYRELGVVFKDSRDDNNNKTPEDTTAFQLVNIGDLVVNKMKAWQGSLGVSPHAGITSPDYVVFVPHHEESSPFLHELLRCRRIVSVYRSISNGIRLEQWRLEVDQFLSLAVFLPPLQEQAQIVEYVRENVQRWEALISEAQRGIELLAERRSALISAAVTGQIDVRAAAERSAA